MPRPNYETQADKDREFTAKLKLAEVFTGKNIVKLHNHYIIDFVIMSGKYIVGVCEFKTCNYSIDKYETFMLSLDKWNKGLGYYNLHNTPFYTLAKYAEGFYLHEYNPTIEYWIELGGRTDRNDPMDIEPIIRIETGHFTHLGGK